MATNRNQLCDINNWTMCSHWDNFILDILFMLVFNDRTYCPFGKPSNVILVVATLIHYSYWPYGDFQFFICNLATNYNSYKSLLIFSTGGRKTVVGTENWTRINMLWRKRSTFMGYRKSIFWIYKSTSQLKQW